MISIVAHFCFLPLGIAACLALRRVVRGPTMLDRTIGFDMLATTVVGAVVLLSVLWHTQLYIELMLIFSLLGFVGAVAFISYLHADLRQRLSRSVDRRPDKPQPKP